MTVEDRHGSRSRSRRGLRHRRSDVTVETVLITSAKRSRLADWRHRRHLYATLQLSRIPLFIGAVAVYGWLDNPVLAAAIAVISLPLPWVAVLLANDPGADGEKGAPKVYKPALVREQRARDLQALTGTAPRTALPPHPASTTRPVIIDDDEETPRT